MLKTLKQQVEEILSQYPDTRNSDIALMIILWKRFYPTKIIDSNGLLKIALRSLYELPREDSVKRYRAEFQNKKNMYLPTTLDIAKKRRINEDVWRETLGYKPTFLTRC